MLYRDATEHMIYLELKKEERRKAAIARLARIKANKCRRRLRLFIAWASLIVPTITVLSGIGYFVAKSVPFFLNTPATGEVVGGIDAIMYVSGGVFTVIGMVVGALLSVYLCFVLFKFMHWFILAAFELICAFYSKQIDIIDKDGRQ